LQNVLFVYKTLESAAKAVIVMDSLDKSAILQALYRKLIDGSHILHYHNVLDAYGHLSFRHPFKADIFVMSHNISPATISSSNHLVEYRVKDSEPVNPSATTGYVERMIHSEIYKRHPDIHAVVHSHSEAVVPYTISTVPLKACYHMAPFLGTTGAPVFDVAEHLRADDIPNMLIKTQHLGAALAQRFDKGNVVTLMRGHGFTAVAHSIESVVLRAVYTQKNAAIQTTALLLQATHLDVVRGATTEHSGLKYLSDEEAEAATDATNWSVQRPWRLWVREVQACPLYCNSA